MNISIDKLRYFVEVATLEHVNKAALKLNISPSVISQSVKELELELDMALFNRVKRKLHLTNEGHELLSKAKKIIESVEALYSSDSSIKGEFKIGISLSIFKDELFNIKKLVDTNKRNPDLKVSINTSDTGKLIDLVINGLLDCAIVYSPLKHENISETVLQETKFKIALKKNHPIFDLPIKERVDYLNTLAAIGFNASVGDNMCQSHPIFDKYGIRPIYKYFYDIDEVALQLVQRTNGWIFTSQNILDRNKSIRELDLGEDWNVPMNISLIRNRLRAKHPAINQIFDV